MVGEMVWFDRHPDTYLKRFTSTRVPHRGSGGRVVDVKRGRGGKAGKVQRGRDGRVEEVRRGREDLQGQRVLTREERRVGAEVKRWTDGRVRDVERAGWWHR